MKRIRTCLIALVVLGAALDARAQATGSDWHRGTTLGVFLGASTSSSVSDAAAGLSLGWELLPHLTGVPGFYRRRMAPDATPFSRRTFDDFAVAFGGGVDVFVVRHLALRPEVTVLLATTRSHTRALPVWGVQLAYHFEDHPVTPVMGGRDAPRASSR
jgi:hypothetical protein